MTGFTQKSAQRISKATQWVEGYRTEHQQIRRKRRVNNPDSPETQTPVKQYTAYWSGDEIVSTPNPQTTITIRSATVNNEVSTVGVTYNSVNNRWRVTSSGIFRMGMRVVYALAESTASNSGWEYYRQADANISSRVIDLRLSSQLGVSVSSTIVSAVHTRTNFEGNPTFGGDVDYVAKSASASFWFHLLAQTQPFFAVEDTWLYAWLRAEHVGQGTDLAFPIIQTNVIFERVNSEWDAIPIAGPVDYELLMETGSRALLESEDDHVGGDWWIPD